MHPSRTAAVATASLCQLIQGSTWTGTIHAAASSTPQVQSNRFIVGMKKRPRGRLRSYRNKDQLPRQEPGRNLASTVVPSAELPQTHLPTDSPAATALPSTFSGFRVTLPPVAVPLLVFLMA